MATAKIRKQIKIGSGPDAIRESKSFTSIREANAWYTSRKAELSKRSRAVSDVRCTLNDAFERYMEEIAPTHRGGRWEIIRITAFQAERLIPITLPLRDITPRHIATWKDARLKDVSPGTVKREMSLLSSVFTACVKDWYWLDVSPMRSVRAPKAPPPVNRTLTRTEIKIMLRTLGYKRGQRPRGMNQMVAYAMLIALRTGMRAGEILSMTWENFKGTWVKLPKTKNGDSRDVPLSPKAQALIKACRDLDEDEVLPITSASLDALFRKARAKAGLEGFTFHTTRHTAATWIGRTVGQPGRLSFPEFCVMFGWRDPKNAFIYVNPNAHELSSRI